MGEAQGVLFRAPEPFKHDCALMFVLIGLRVETETEPDVEQA
jgi:hypothetical protein